VKQNSQDDLKEVDRVIREVDEALRLRGIPIHARPLHAVGEVSNRLGVWETVPWIDIGRKSREPTISDKVHDWYDKNYGDRVKIFMGPGTIAISIRGDPWLVRFPLLFGEFAVACIPDISSWHGPQGKPVLNALDSIQHLGPSLRASLTEVECQDILSAFIRGFEALQALERLDKRKFIHEAIGDERTAVEHLSALPPQYGLSRWHSLQFVEKLLKCFLVSRGERVPKHHKVQSLALSAERLGLPALDSDLLAKVQCASDVRYGEVGSTLAQAMEAHSASLEICRLIAPQIELSRDIQS
jgi:hypothetical protein